MNGPQHSTVGGAKPIVVQIDGQDTAEKVKLIGQLNQFLTEKARKVKLLYLPSYNQLPNTQEELLLGSSIIRSYLEKGWDCITNLSPLSVLTDNLISLNLDQKDTEQAYKQILDKIETILRPETSLDVMHPQQIKLETKSMIGLASLSFTKLQPLNISKLNATSYSIQPPGLESGYQQAYQTLMTSLLARAKHIEQTLLKTKAYSPMICHQLSMQVLPVSTIRQAKIKVSKDTIITSGFNAKMTSHADQLAANYQIEDDVVLTQFQPRNELNLAVQCLFQFSDLPMNDIESNLRSLSYDKKTEIIYDYFTLTYGQGKALRSANYQYEILTNFYQYFELKQQANKLLLHQPLTPRYGFEVPTEIEEAGLSVQFESCFDDSSALHSQLHQQYGLDIAQFSCLLGHRIRFNLEIDLPVVFTLPDSELKDKILNKTADVHPYLVNLIRASS